MKRENLEEDIATATLKIMKDSSYNVLGGH